MAKNHQMLLLRGVRGLIGVLAVAVIGATLALRPTEPLTSQNEATGRFPVQSSAVETQVATTSTDLAADDRYQQQLLAAQIAMVCPSGAREFEKIELVSGQQPATPSAQILGARPTAPQPPLRVAMNGSASGLGSSASTGQWLVDPGDWFAPEDQALPGSASPSSTPQTPAEEQLVPQPEFEFAPQVGTTPEAAPNGPTGPTDAPVEQPAPPRTLPSPATSVEPETPPQDPPVVGPSLEWDEPRSTAPVAPNSVIPSPVIPSPAASRPAVTDSPAPSPASVVEPPQSPSPPPRALFAPPPQGLPNPHAKSGTSAAAPTGPTTRPEEDPHHDLFAETLYPSAQTCAKCHQQIYDEWSTSSHAYAFVSPMFHKFEQKITELSQGTVGYFCIRCHSPVSTSLNIPRDTPLWEMPQVAREGVTCIVCHRVRQPYGKSNGERHIVPGDIYAPVYGTSGGAGVAEVIAQKDKHKVKTSPEDKGPGQPIHTAGLYFEQLGAAEFCQTCHQVAVHPGIKLEVVWEQYRQSPAYKKGVTCQDCHMGKVPGVASGYDCAAVAEINGVKIGEGKKHSNHVFYGPGYSIAHPGIFPMHLKADRWTIDQWLLFDWRAGWGTDEFEERLDRGEILAQFPQVWAEADDRYDAREIIEENLKKLDHKTKLRKQVMENGATVDGPFFANAPTARRGLKLSYVVTNTNEGHNLPTASLGAQPQLWANVVLIGPRGERLWETGYIDRYGDLCNHHSRDVRAGLIPADSQLFNLQTMFLITGATGTDREFLLPVNLDFDQLPFLRPGAQPISVINHPPFIRMEQRSLAPLGKKEVHYSIPPEALPYPGRYRLSFRMRSRAEPIYFMDFCGATTEMQRAMNEGMIDVHPFSVEFDVH